MYPSRRKLLKASAGFAMTVPHLFDQGPASARENKGAMDPRLLDQVSVFDFMTEQQIDDIRSGNAQVDVTAPLQTCLDSPRAAGRTVRFPPGTYLMGRIYPQSNTNIWLDERVILRKKSDGRGILRLANVQNVHVFCHGATLDGSAPDAKPSHTVYFESARRCSIRNANVLGAGDRKDCIYVGEGLHGPSEDVLIAGGSCVNARRNGISVVSGRRTLIDGVEIFGTTGGPGAGVDVESNEYDRATDTEIRNCRIHDNVNFGIVVVFGDRVKIHRNLIYANKQGIASSPGGAQFHPKVYRRNVDVRGVSAFDSATGWISVGGDPQTLPVGTIVLFHVSEAATVPLTFRKQVRWVVNERMAGASGTEILLGRALHHEVVTALSDTGSGRMSNDPAASQVRMVCYLAGQSSGLDIRDNAVYGNTQRGISIGGSVNVAITGNKILHGGSMNALQISYCRHVQLESNTVDRDPASHPTNGIALGTSHYVRTSGNVVIGFPGAGIASAGVSESELDGDTVLNCGSIGGAAVRLNEGSRVQVTRLRVANDLRHPANFGVQAVALRESTFRDIDSTGAGSSNATSISIGGNTLANSRLRDGTLGTDGRR